jgi:hypothetical protein
MPRAIPPPALLFRCFVPRPKNNKTPDIGGLGANTDSALHHRRDQDMNLFASMFKPVPNELRQFGPASLPYRSCPPVWKSLPAAPPSASEFRTKGAMTALRPTCGSPHSTGRPQCRIDPFRASSVQNPIMSACPSTRPQGFHFKWRVFPWPNPHCPLPGRSTWIHSQPTRCSARTVPKPQGIA